MVKKFNVAKNYRLISLSCPTAHILNFILSLCSTWFEPLRRHLLYLLDYVTQTEFFLIADQKKFKLKVLRNEICHYVLSFSDVV